MEKSGMLQSQFEHQQADPQGKVLAGELGWPRSPCNPMSPASGSYTDASRFLHSQTSHEFKFSNFGWDNRSSHGKLQLRGLGEVDLCIPLSPGWMGRASATSANAHLLCPAGRGDRAGHTSDPLPSLILPRT